MYPLQWSSSLLGGIVPIQDYIFYKKTKTDHTVCSQLCSLNLSCFTTSMHEPACAHLLTAFSIYRRFLLLSSCIVGTRIIRTKSVKTYMGSAYLNSLGRLHKASIKDMHPRQFNFFRFYLLDGYLCSGYKAFVQPAPGNFMSFYSAFLVHDIFWFIKEPKCTSHNRYFKLIRYKLAKWVEWEDAEKVYTISFSLYSRTNFNSHTVIVLGSSFLQSIYMDIQISWIYINRATMQISCINGAITSSLSITQSLNITKTFLY